MVWVIAFVVWFLITNMFLESSMAGEETGENFLGAAMVALIPTNLIMFVIQIIFF